MSLTVNFTQSQILGNPSVIVYEDISAGSDGAVTSRRIYQQKYDATYIVPAGTTTDYIVWPYADATISVDSLDKSYAISAVVQWLNVSGQVLYSKTILNVFKMYLDMFDDQLITSQQANPLKVSDTNYYSNRMRLRIAINDAYNSITEMSDITNSQQACDRGTFLITNASNFY